MYEIHKFSQNFIYGTIFYDFENDRYTYLYTYLSDGKRIEDILTKWMKDKSNPDDIWDGKISEDFEDEKQKWAIDFYKSYIDSGTDLDFEDYYKQTEQWQR